MPLTLRRAKSPPYLPWAENWYSAYTAQNSAAKQAHVGIYGDSISEGYFAGEPYIDQSWIAQVGDAFNARTTVAAGRGPIPLGQHFDLTVARRGTLLSRTGTWTSAGTVGLFRKSQYSTAVGNTLTIGPVTCAQFRITHVRGSSQAAWSAAVDGGAAVAFTSVNATLGLATEVIDVTPGVAHTLVITQTSTGNFQPIYLDAVTSATAGVKVSRLAATSQQTSALISNLNNADSRPCALAASPDCAVFAFGVNEWANSTALATFSANLTTTVTTWKATGASVVLVVPPPPDPAYASPVWADYADVIRTVAITNETGLVDITAAWGTRAANVSYYFDSLHPSVAGAAAISALVSNYLLSSIGVT